AEIAHSLRGSAASMGFPRVAAQAKNLELAARRMPPETSAPANSVEALGEMLARVRVLSDEADAALQKWLAIGAVSGNS
ncbi:MAG: Hpt domain-containing protein, partial [Usitatibacteraceae bacterium]